MNPPTINAIANATERAVAATAAAKQEFLSVLRSLPGGERLLRRELSMFNLSPETFERLLRGVILPEDTAILAGLKIANS